MEFLLPSFLAGVLTILSPCTFSLLPVVLGGTVGQKEKYRPLIVAISLGVSMFAFTLLVKGSTLLIGVPFQFWKILSGVLILIFAFTMLFPMLWSKIAFKLGFFKSEKLLADSAKKRGFMGAVLIGASMGPVFSSCSPTYALLLAIVLPTNFAVGALNVLLFAIGLMIPVLAIGYGGQRASQHFKWMVNPTGLFKKSLAVFLVIVGLLVSTGYDKKLSNQIFVSGYAGAIDIEQGLLETFR